jgi:diaphanous 1
MPVDSLIVPVLLPNGSLHFADITPESTVQDVQARLVCSNEVRREVLGELQSDLWRMQRIRKENVGRVWEEDELESLGDGML